jgi:hypothetical protein
VTADKQAQKPEGINRRRLALDLLAMPVFFALFLFLPAGTWAWAKGWLFLLVFVTSAALAWAYLWRVNPELLVGSTGRPCPGGPALPATPCSLWAWRC